MAKYTSKYLSLGFYVNGELKRFSNGVYKTDDKAEISVLDGLRDVQKEKSAEIKKVEVKSEDQPKVSKKSSAK